MRGRLSRLGRVSAAVALVGAMLLGPLGLAPAQADLSTFSATGTGFALRVTVDLSGLPDAVKTQISDAYTQARDALPAEAQAELPDQFPFVIDQYIGRTTSDASQSNENFVTEAVSILGDGFQDLGSVTASEVPEKNTSTTDSVSVPPSDTGLSVLTADVGELLAEVQAGPIVDGQATLAEVNATLVQLAALLPAELATVIQQVVDAVNAAVATAEAEIDAVLGTVADTVNDTSDTACSDPVLGPVLGDAGLCTDDTVENTTTQLQNTVNIPEIPNPLDSDLATVTDISTATTAQKGNPKADADASSLIKSVDVLNGFLSVGLIDLSSHSEAAGEPGTASNQASCSIADVRLGGEEGVALDGSNVYVGGEPVPVVGDTVDTLKTQVDSVLDTAGISVDLCDATQANAAEDGTSASQQVSAFVVTIEPPAPADVDLLGTQLSAGDPLGVKITIDPTVQTAVSAQVAEPAPVSLPRTGAPALLTVLSGAVLAGGALAIRRRLR